jgi:hypothetical protein
MGTPRGGGYVFENLALGRYRVGVGRALDELGPSAADVELSRPGQIIDIELAAPETKIIAGSVVDGKGVPVPDSWVRASLMDKSTPFSFGGTDAVLSNADGTFELPPLSRGRYVVTAQHQLGEGRALEVEAGRRDLVVVLDDYGTLAGVVTLPDGQPAPAFSVLLMPQPWGDPLRANGERGYWSLSWLAPGDYRVVVMSARGGRVANAHVDPGRKTELPLSLDPALAGVAVQSSAFRN